MLPVFLDLLNPLTHLNVRFALPAQTVDATPSNALIRQCFFGRIDLRTRNISLSSCGRHNVQKRQRSEERSESGGLV
jgi:hypothetical protein